MSVLAFLDFYPTPPPLRLPLGLLLIALLADRLQVGVFIRPTLSKCETMVTDAVVGAMQCD